MAEALEMAGETEELIIIGGASLYQHFLPEADRLYLTLIEREFEGDAYFPPFSFEDWRVVMSETVTDDPSVDFTYRFLVLEKRFQNQMETL